MRNVRLFFCHAKAIAPRAHFTIQPLQLLLHSSGVHIRRKNCLSRLIIYVSTSTPTAVTCSSLSVKTALSDAHVSLSLMYRSTFIPAHASNTICANLHPYLCNLTHHYVLYQAQRHTCILLTHMHPLILVASKSVLSVATSAELLYWSFCVYLFI